MVSDQLKAKFPVILERKHVVRRRSAPDAQAKGLIIDRTGLGEIPCTGRRLWWTYGKRVLTPIH